MDMIPSKKVFVSSTTKDLWQYRQEAEKIIDQISAEYVGRFQLQKVTMDTENLDGDRKEPIVRSGNWVKECHWVVLIVAWNYGYVPDGEIISVTKCEYEEAEKSKKPCFVFLAGEKHDGEQKQYYFDRNIEKENLSEWKEAGKIPENHIKLLNDFKTKLREKDFKIFNGLLDFSDQLRGALKKRVEFEMTEPSSTPESKPDFILKLIFDLKEPIEKCISRVSRLETYKSIHDQLHEMRQNVIRPLREGILPKWEESEELSRPLERRLTAHVAKGRELQGEIKKTMKDIGDKYPNFSEPLRIIVDTKLLSDEGDVEPTYDDFFSKIESLAFTVQEAFTTANSLMTMQNGLLDKFHATLFEKITKRKKFLTAEQNQQLDSELERVAMRREQLTKVITIHNQWQKFHDSFETVDLFKEGHKFESRLRDFCNAQTIAFTNEIKAELSRVHDEESPDESLINGINQLGIYWRELNSAISIETYEAMRKEFDDIFYNLDKRTLNEVEAAGACANEFKQLLETLRAQDPQ